MDELLAGVGDLDRREVSEDRALLVVLVAIVWRSLEENPWLSIPKEIALRHLPPPPEDGRTCGPGPFSWSNPEVVSAILNAVPVP